MSSNRIENESGLIDKPAGWSAEESIGQARRSGGAGCNMSSLLVDLFTCLLDPTRSDLHPAITLATTVHSFHIRERHI